MTQAVSSEPRSCLNVGQRLGAYRIIRQISEGGMAVVFEAINEQGRRSAIKILHPQCPDTEEITSRFLNEAEALRRVQHPGVVAFLERDRFPDGSHYIVMEYLEGSSIRDRLNSVPGKGFKEPEALEWTRQLASALHAIHGKNIIHRDVRPENVYIVRDVDGRERAKLRGFGHAQLPGAMQRLREGDSTAVEFPPTGTEVSAYTAPEQCDSAGQVEGKSDVYSLGVMLYEMLAGHLPLEGTWMELLSKQVDQAEAPLPLDKLPSTTSPETIALLEAMLAKSLRARLTARQVAERGEQLMERHYPNFVLRLPPPEAPPRSGLPQAGDQIGRYRVIRCIQDGGMGIVFEALHEQIERRVAVKVLKKEYAQNGQVVTRFLNEARAVNLVRHPGLVEIFDYGHFPDGRPYIVMEYLDGIRLSRRIEDAGHRLPPRSAAGLTRQIAQIMAAVHEKDIIHRDLKPDNIMLVSRANEPEEVVKIIDFGVARLPSPTSEVAERGMLLGTPLYMPPEQCFGKSEVDAKADVYSLGATLYQMLAGRTPFVADEMGVAMMMQIEQQPPPLPQTLGLPAGLSDLVMQMLAKGSNQRPTMAEVARTLTTLEQQLIFKAQAGQTIRMAAVPGQFPSNSHPESGQASFMEEVGNLLQRRMTQRLTSLSHRVLKMSAARWPVVRDAIAQIQTGLDVPPPRVLMDRLVSARTISLESAGDLAYGWIVGLNGQYRDVTFKLRERMVLGTAPHCDVVLEDPRISARHCEIRKVEGGFKLSDLGSTNGVVVNDKKIEKEHFLIDNDNFRIGRTEFKFKSIYS